MNSRTGQPLPQSPEDRMVKRATRRAVVRASLHRLADRVALAELSPAVHDAEQSDLNHPVRRKIRAFQRMPTGEVPSAGKG